MVVNVSLGPVFAVVLVVLSGVASLFAVLGRLGVGIRILTASLRAVVQLAVVSALIAVALRSLALTGVFAAVMYAVATVTSGQRLRRDWRGLWAGVGIAAGVVPTLVLILATGLVPLHAVAILPIAGILIGGAMTATSLCGRRALDELRTRRGEYEAALAIGLPERPAALEICRHAAAHALMPALDQTRTVGLVTLPGAFVGMLLGGASPLEAGATQLLVLIGLLAVETIAALVILELIAAGKLTLPHV